MSGDFPVGPTFIISRAKDSADAMPDKKTCPFCFKSYTHRGLATHIRAKHPHDYKEWRRHNRWVKDLQERCPFCHEKVFSRDLLAHVREAHPDQLPLLQVAYPW